MGCTAKRSPATDKPEPCADSRRDTTWFGGRKPLWRLYNAPLDACYQGKDALLQEALTTGVDSNHFSKGGEGDRSQGCTDPRGRTLKKIKRGECLRPESRRDEGRVNSP